MCTEPTTTDQNPLRWGINIASFWLFFWVFCGRSNTKCEHPICWPLFCVLSCGAQATVAPQLSSEILSSEVQFRHGLLAFTVSFAFLYISGSMDKLSKRAVGSKKVTNKYPLPGRPPQQNFEDTMLDCLRKQRCFSLSLEIVRQKQGLAKLLSEERTALWKTISYYTQTQGQSKNLVLSSFKGLRRCVQPMTVKERKFFWKIIRKHGLFFFLKQGCLVSTNQSIYHAPDLCNHHPLHTLLALSNQLKYRNTIKRFCSKSQVIMQSPCISQE